MRPFTISKAYLSKTPMLIELRMNSTKFLAKNSDDYRDDGLSLHTFIHDFEEIPLRKLRRLSRYEVSANAFIHNFEGIPDENSDAYRVTSELDEIPCEKLCRSSRRGFQPPYIHSRFRRKTFAKTPTIIELRPFSQSIHSQFR